MFDLKGEMKQAMFVFGKNSFRSLNPCNHHNGAGRCILVLKFDSNRLVYIAFHGILSLLHRMVNFLSSDVRFAYACILCSNHFIQD